MSITQNTLSIENRDNVTPFDIVALENQVRETLALSGIDYDALKLSLPAQPPAPVLGGSGAGLVEIDSFETWVETQGNAARYQCLASSEVMSDFTRQMLCARALLDEYRIFKALGACNE